MTTKKRMTQAQYRAVFDRALECGFEACEAMIPGTCTGVAQQWHHRKLRSQGGGHEAANGLAVCASCHNEFHLDPARAYENGWLVHGWHDPAEIPVNYRGRFKKLGGE